MNAHHHAKTGNLIQTGTDLGHCTHMRARTRACRHKPGRSYRFVSKSRERAPARQKRLIQNAENAESYVSLFTNSQARKEPTMPTPHHHAIIKHTRPYARRHIFDANTQATLCGLKILRANHTVISPLSSKAHATCPTCRRLETKS